MKIEIIAEIGINHAGNMDTAKKMIDAAARAGADVAKFQWYDADKVLGKDSPYLAEARAAQFTLKQHRELRAHCEKAGIEWMVSAFDKERLNYLLDLGMNRIKVASRAAMDDEFMSEVYKSNLPVVISCGLAGLERVDAINKALGFTRERTFLYCVAKYPCKASDLNLSEMKVYKKFSKNTGLSSHCPSIGPTLAAIDLGASMIEHHVVLNKSQKGCDVSSSITFDELSRLVSESRNATDKITLVPISTPEHVEWMRKQRSMPQLYKYFRQDAPICKEAQIRWWNTLDKGAVRLFIVKHITAGYIGYVGFNPISARSGRAEFGCFVIPQFQKKGYSKRSLLMLLRLGFETYNLKTIYSDVLDYPGEDRFEFYRKLGFEAFPKEHQTIRYQKQGVSVPSIKFFMTQDMWRQLHGQNDDGGLAPVAAGSAGQGC